AAAAGSVSSRTRRSSDVSRGMCRTPAGPSVRRRPAGRPPPRAPDRTSRPELTDSRARALRLAEAQDGLALGGEDAVEVVEAQDLEDVEDGLVQLGETDVAAVAPDLLDRPHDRAEARARDVGQPGAVDHDLETVLLERLLDLPLEHPDRVGVDEALRVEQGDVLELARLDLEFSHESGDQERRAATRGAGSRKGVFIA